MTLRITDHYGKSYLCSANCIAEYIKNQAFVAFYDGAQIAQDNEMRPLDWVVSTLLAAPIRRYSAFETLWQDNGKLLNECNHALAALGPDISLEHEDSLQLREKVEAAFEAFMQPTGIESSIAAKILHKKRPRLIPVIDDFASTVLSGKRGYELSEKMVAGVIFDRFRPQLLSNLPALREVTSLLAGTPTPLLSAIRILDITIWRHADQNRERYQLPSAKSPTNQPPCYQAML